MRLHNNGRFLRARSPLQLFCITKYRPVHILGELNCCHISVSQEEWTKLWESVPYVEQYRYNPKHLYPKLNGYGDNGQRNLKL